MNANLGAGKTDKDYPSRCTGSHYQRSMYPMDRFKAIGSH